MQRHREEREHGKCDMKQWFPLCLQMRAEVTEPWKARTVTREAFSIKASQRNTLLTSQFWNYRSNFVINSYCSISLQMIYDSCKQYRNYRTPRIEIKMNKMVLQIKIELTKSPQTNTALKGWNIFYQTWENITKMTVTKSTQNNYYHEVVIFHSIWIWNIQNIWKLDKFPSSNWIQRWKAE